MGQKGDNPVLHRTYGHPELSYYSIITTGCYVGPTELKLYT